MAEGSKITIYDLLTPESKTVDITINGNTISVLLKKLDSYRNDEYRRLLADLMEGSLGSIMNDTERIGKIDEYTKGQNKKQLVESILQFETMERRLKLDLIDIEDEDNLDDLGLEKKRDEKLKAWEERRATEYNTLTKNDLVSKFRGMCLAKLAEQKAMEEVKYILLYCKCFDPDNPSRRFFSLDEKDKHNKKIPFHPKELVPDFINTLLLKLVEFDPAIDERDVRRLAESPDFLASTISPENNKSL